MKHPKLRRRVSAGGLALLGLICVVAPAIGKGNPGKAASRQPAHQWNLEERLRLRFDPEHLRQRQLATPVAPTGESLEGWYLVDGSQNPELFLPCELFGHLIGTGFDEDHPERRERWRTGLAPKANELGIGDELWPVLETVAAAYLADLQAFESEATESPLVKAGVCRNKADALAAARATFGRETFDRFLYEGVAPKLMVRSRGNSLEIYYRALAECCDKAAAERERAKRGGSVGAWVAAEEGAIDPVQAVGRLTFLAACDSDVRSVLELDRTAVERPVSKDGFLQFTGLAPGSYSLEVRQPGWALARIANVVVAPQAETFLREPLLLTRPIALEVEINPPVDERSEPWHAQVIRRVEGDSRPAPIVFDGPADLQGRFTVTEQTPGWFRILVLDSQGNRVHSEAEHELDATTRHRIELERVAIEGRLRLGSEPLAGSLWFGGRHGATRIKMEADEEGRFSGLLPSQLFWIVEIEGSKPSFQARTRTEIRPDRAGRATVTIDLPDTRVFGRIVDHQGRPVPGAALVATTEAVDQRVKTEEPGTFDLRGLPEGLLALIATDGKSGQSERMLVSMVQGRAVGPIELRLRPVRQLNGKVVSAHGPVAGARIVALANSPAVGGGEAMTGAEGTFSLQLPANVESATAVVKAPGFGTQAFQLAVTEEAMSLLVSQAAGEVAITLPQAATDLQRANLRVALLQNGLEVPISLLRADALASAAEGAGSAPILHLASLAPGQYSACIARKQVDTKGSLDHKQAAAVSCDSGQLAPGATLGLTLREKD